MEFRVFFEEKGQGDMSNVFMLLVFAIAALLAISVIKPMFRRSTTVVQKLGNTVSPTN